MIVGLGDRSVDECSSVLALAAIRHRQNNTVFLFAATAIVVLSACVNPCVPQLPHVTSVPPSALVEAVIILHAWTVPSGAELRVLGALHLNVS